MTRVRQYIDGIDTIGKYVDFYTEDRHVRRTCTRCVHVAKKCPKAAEKSTCPLDGRRSGQVHQLLAQINANLGLYCFVKEIEIQNSG